MREALEVLLSRLECCGMEKPAIVLLQSVVGRTGPRAFLDAAHETLGAGLVERWLGLLEQHDYAGTNALLTAHSMGALPSCTWTPSRMPMHARAGLHAMTETMAFLMPLVGTPVRVERFTGGGVSVRMKADRLRFGDCLVTRFGH